MWGGVYEIQFEGCDDFYIGEEARSSEVRFKERVPITTASITAVVDHLRCSGHMYLGYQPLFDSCERRGHVPQEWPVRVAIEYFVGLQR